MYIPYAGSDEMMLRVNRKSKMEKNNKIVSLSLFSFLIGHHCQIICVLKVWSSTIGTFGDLYVQLKMITVINTDIKLGII
jgi:hypothetical protein